MIFDDIELEREVKRQEVEWQSHSRIKCVQCHMYMQKDTVSLYCLKCSKKRILLFTVMKNAK